MTQTNNSSGARTFDPVVFFGLAGTILTSLLGILTLIGQFTAFQVRLESRLSNTEAKIEAIGDNIKTLKEATLKQNER
jgi:hypothetical protein